MWPEKPDIDGPKPREQEKSNEVVSFGCLAGLGGEEIISITCDDRWRVKAFLPIHFSEKSF
jgi:hypothetical protein